MNRVLRVLTYVENNPRWWAMPYNLVMWILLSIVLLFVGCAVERKLTGWHLGKPCILRNSEVEAICGKFGMHDPETHFEIWGSGPLYYCVENYRDGARARAVQVNPPLPFHCDGDTHP